MKRGVGAQPFGGDEAVFENVAAIEMGVVA